MSDQQKLLEVRDLTKTFRVPHSGKGANNRLCALDGISLDLARGETLGLVGESGCGKSTLARTLMMLERPDSGTVAFDGIDPFTLGGKELMKFRRRVQMVFQDPYASLNARMTAADIISEPWRTHKTLYKTRNDRTMRMRGLLDLVGLGAGAADKYPQEFSGGQRQRIGIARALALDPDVIICDEPVSALDLSVQAQVLNLLNDLQQQLGISYIFISHDLSVVRHVADRVSVMYLGRIIESGRNRSGFRASRSSVHRRADVGGAEAGCQPPQGEDPALGRDPVTAEPAVGMPVPDQVLEGHRGVRHHPAAAGGRPRGSGPHRRMPSSAAPRRCK